jgi:tetratricopeptide (TPR) repeat protein
MSLRTLIGLLAITALMPHAMAQEADPQEPRTRIQIDVTATVPDDERWIEIQSKNFLLAGTAKENDIRRVAADLELLRDTFAQFSPRLNAISSVPTTVIVLRDESSLRYFRPADEGQADRPKGYVQAGRDKNYIVLRQSGSIPREIYRDYIRLLIPEAIAPVPLWFREGLADYFSALQVNRYLFGDKRWTRLGTGIDEYDRLLDKKAKLLPLETLFRIHEESPEYATLESRDLFLAQSWGIVHFLMSRPGGLAAMQRVFDTLGDGQSLEEAVRQRFGRRANLLEDDFKRHIRLSQSEHQWSGTIRLLSKSASQVAKGECGMMMLTGVTVPFFPQCNWSERPPPGIFKIPYAFDKTWNEVSELKARTLSEPEVWFHRGDLMLHIGRSGEAEAYLRRSIDQLPQSSAAQTSLGILKLQQKNYSEAEEALKTAIEVDPKNYVAHYHRAVLMQIRATQGVPSYDDLEDIHDGLLKVIALAPQFVEAAGMLAGINILRHTAIKESEKALIDAIKRSPGRTDLWIVLANVTARAGDAAATRWLLTRLLAAGATDAASRKAATTLLEGVAPGEARSLLGTPIAAGVQQGAIPVTTAAQRSASRPANRNAGEKLRGVLIDIDCKNGLTLTIKTGGKAVKLHTRSPFSVDFFARDREDRSVSPGAVVCGPAPGEGVDVSVTYRPVRSGDSLGEPLTVEMRLEDPQP